MNYTSLVMLAGGGVGVGVLFLATGLRPKTPSLSEVVAAYEPAAGSTVGAEKDDVQPSHGRLGALGALLDRVGNRIGHPLFKPEDLAITSSDSEEQLAMAAAAALGGAVLGVLLSLVGGSLIPLAKPIVVLVFVLVGGGGGAWVRARSLQEKATAERERFVRAFGCWLELVALAQAGGMGVESALRASYSISDDPSFRRLAVALEQARYGAVTPWDALRRLGEQIGVPALSELAATLGLAGTAGARVRASLLAKSESLRQRAISEAEAKANATTERLFLPSIILMLAFLVFLMFPAGVRLAGLM